MKIGYARVSTEEQSLDIQIDALVNDGVHPDNIYYDKLSGVAKTRPYYESCIKSLRKGDTLVIYSLDRLGRSVLDMINIAERLKNDGINLRILDGIAKGIDTTTSLGKVFFVVASAFAEYEREIIRERTNAGLQAARKKGRIGGRKPALTAKQVRTAQAAIKGGAVVKDLADELGVTRKTIYQYFSPTGELRDLAKDVLSKK